MAGQLNFSLGLITSGFLSGISSADAKVKGFIGGMISLGAITRGVMGAIAEGAELERLHKRTGESVSDLVKLREGFEAAGLSADDAGPALFLMQRSLGGINETGQGTAKVFESMGLSMEKLKAMGGPQAMKTILESLKKMNQSDAAKASSEIFGRGNAGNMIELARSSSDFAAGIADAAAKAALFERNSAAFQRLMVTTQQIKENVGTMFAGIAAGAAPGIQQIQDKLNALDLTGIGESIGKYLTSLTQAFSEGTFGQLIAESMRVGFEGGLGFILPVLESLGSALLRMFQTPLTYLAAGIDWVILRLLDAMNSIPPIFPGVGRTRYPAGVKPPSFGEIKAGIDQEGTLGKWTSSATADSKARMAAALANLKKIAGPLQDMFDGLVDRAGARGYIVKRGGGKGGAANPDDVGGYRPQFTSLEKMGFVMSGGGNSNFASATAQNTARTATAAEQTAQYIQDLLQQTHPDWKVIHE